MEETTVQGGATSEELLGEFAVEELEVRLEMCNYVICVRQVCAWYGNNCHWEYYNGNGVYGGPSCPSGWQQIGCG